MEKKVERKKQNRASTYRKYWNKNRCNELTSGRALNPKKRKKKWLKENKPENGWKQCQYPQGTLGDPVIRKQTSTDQPDNMMNERVSLLGTHINRDSQKEKSYPILEQMSNSKLSEMITPKQRREKGQCQIHDSPVNSQVIWNDNTQAKIP